VLSPLWISFLLWAAILSLMLLVAFWTTK
jgi:hypothetical protein